MIIDIGTAGGLDARQSLEGRCPGELVQFGCPGKNHIRYQKPWFLRVSKDSSLYLALGAHVVSVEARESTS